MPEQIRAALISLGCPKNVVDSEKVLGQIVESGGLVCEDVADAVIIVINTCTFIEDATSESLDVIHEAIERKQAGECRAVVVFGCLAQLHGKALVDEMPEVDAWVGVDEEAKIAEICRSLTEDGPGHCAPLHVDRARGPLASHDARLRITPGHFAYLKISEGCDNVCAFCIIPRIRGRHRSKPREAVLGEAAELAGDGARELVVVAQDTTDYGRDLYGKRELAGLLHDLGRIDGLRWIRLLFAFPAHFDDGMIEELATNPKIVDYLDLPIQHINDRLLKLMGREAGRERTESLIARLRERIPGLVLRTSVIVGYPSETEEEFQELLGSLQEARFERLGAFRYSHEPGTVAHGQPGQVPEGVSSERLDRVMAVQKSVAFEHAREVVGRKVEVVIDRESADAPDVWEGRSYGEAPEIDGVIRVQGAHLEVGQFYECEVTAADGYDLVAIPVDPRYAAPDGTSGCRQVPPRPGDASSRLRL